MTKHRVHIGNLHIRMSSIKGDPAAIAAEIGREVMNAAAGLSKGRTGKIDLTEVPVGKVKMSNSVAKDAASTVSGKLAAMMGGGKK